jgi:hypothetical protein
MNRTAIMVIELLVVVIASALLIVKVRGMLGT